MKRILVSLGALAAMFAARLLDAPGVDSHLLRALTRSAGLGGDSPQLSVVALGLMPAIPAFLVVELAAALVPRWRALRRGGPLERYRLRVAALLLTVILATVQGWSVAVWASQPLRFGTLLSPEVGPRLLVVASMVGGTCFLLLLVGIIDRFGVGSGFSLMLAGSALPALLSFGAVIVAAAQSTVLDVSDVLPLAVLTALGAGALWLLRRPLRESPPRLRAPASSVVPLSIAAALLALPASLRNLGWDVPVLEPGTKPYHAALGALVALFTVALARWFVRPARIAQVWSRVDPLPHGALEEAERLAQLRSLLFNGGLFAAPLLMEWLRLPIALDALSVVVLIAVSRDLLDELSARRKEPALVDAWPLHDVTLLAPALAALSRAGIFAYARAANHRTLLQFFGPHVPIDLLVPRERAEEAQEILEEVLLG